MELKTYANIMNQTGQKPWLQFNSKKREFSIIPGEEKRRNINLLARYLFKREFMKKYKGKEIIFENTKGKKLSFRLKDIQICNNHANYTDYCLAFTPSDKKYYLLNPFRIDKDKYCFEDPANKFILKNLGNLKLKKDSEKLIEEMLIYNFKK